MKTHASRTLPEQRHFSTRSALHVIAVCALLACGTSPSDGGSTSSGTSTGTGPVVDPACAQPLKGLAVCGGPNHCPYTGCAFAGTYCGHADDCMPDCDYGGFVGPCFGSESLAQASAMSIGCGDGGIYAGLGDSKPALCLSATYGDIYCDNNAGNELRYADYSSYTCGTPLPEPTSCPTISGVPLCGAACGGCLDSSNVCTGRSPLHPYSVCIPKSPRACSTGCLAGEKCFRFTVSPADQTVADAHGLCLPGALCDALAAGLPGGGACASLP